MLNYHNLSDVEFENLCLDVMSSKLNTQLHKFAHGRDGGVDLRNHNEEIIIQVKHYINSSTAQLLSALKGEVTKLAKLKPKKYYICCSKTLSPQRIDEIYNLFSDFMASTGNIITLNEIDEFLVADENIEILKRHYKLWLSSTNILEDIFTKDIGVDSEILFSNIKTEMQFFVKTKAYDLALDCLHKTRALLIIGEPGVGKTITSKILILHFLSEGYRLRYTTDGDNLSDLKKSLTLNPEQREVIFLDDCFGQAYFRMKETQSNELLYIIRHVNLHSNKVIILNSRITIYTEAQSKTPELIKSFNNREYKLFLLDMGKIADIDRAEILYNHLYFNDIKQQYFDAIKYNKNYLEIIKHPNYNPRIIEYISNKNIYEQILPENYFAFIINNLDNPKEVWKDEYENRLKDIDRILLTTIFSLTETVIPAELVKKCFEKRLQKVNGIDYSLNNFDIALRRLTRAFIKIVDSYGIKMLSMVNPSINDFLDSYLEENILERNRIIENGCSVRQLKRLLPQEKYLSSLLKLFETHEILTYYFENDDQRVGFITNYVAIEGIKDVAFLQIVQSYLWDAKDVDIYDKSKIYPITVLQKLLNKELIVFYKIDDLLLDELFLMGFLDKFQFDDLISILLLIEEYFTGECRAKFIEISKDIILEKVEWYCYDVPAENYQIDIGEIADFYRQEDYIDGIKDEIENEVSELVIDEVRDYLQQLPNDFKIDEKFLDNVEVTVSGAQALVDDYFADVDYDPELLYDRDFANDNEIDLIFNRIVDD